MHDLTYMDPTFKSRNANTELTCAETQPSVDSVVERDPRAPDLFPLAFWNNIKLASRSPPATTWLGVERTQISRKLK